MIASDLDLAAMATRIRDVIDTVPADEPVSAICHTPGEAERLKGMLTPAELARVAVTLRFE